MARCQAVCRPEAPQELVAGRGNHGQEQAGGASWKSKPLCGGEGQSGRELAGGQVSGLGRGVGGRERDASVCV